VELMETTSTLLESVTSEDEMASIIGSGINGNKIFPSRFHSTNSGMASIIGSGINGNLVQVILHFANVSSDMASIIGSGINGNPQLKPSNQRFAKD